jgi:hypothetical protein
MPRREERDVNYLAVLEDMTQSIRAGADAFMDEQRDSAHQARKSRFDSIKGMIDSERRLIEEVSPPCRLIIEHFSTFLDHPDRAVTLRYGQFQYTGGSYLGYTINEWGHVTLMIGNSRVTWHDEEYQYMFYADRVVLRAYDLQKPEISFEFHFSLKYSKLLDEFKDVPGHPQTAYYQPDLFDE